MRSFIPIGLWILNTKLETGLSLSMKPFLKGKKDKFQICISKLFHSAIVQGKKDDLNTSVLHSDI